MYDENQAETKYDELHEAFLQLAEDRAAVERQIALDLPDDGIFPIFWNMASQAINLGLKCKTEKDAGNTLALFTEELPSAMHNAGVDAKTYGRDATATIALLDDMQEKALTAIGDAVYRDHNMDRRRHPEQVMERPARSPRQP